MLRVLPEKNKIVVEGVNRVYKHLKPSQKNQQGGRLSKEMPIDVSNVMLYCSACNRGVRVGHRFTDDGQKQRYCKTCGAEPGQRRPAQAGRTPRKARAAARTAIGVPATAIEAIAMYPVQIDRLGHRSTQTCEG